MNTTPLRFLIVEDEILVAMCLELELKQAGYIISKRVTTGEEAITAAMQDPPDIILMDIRLAGKLDGIEAAQQIQAIAAIPIIFVTAYPEKEELERAMKLHPLGFFPKPMRITDIQALMESIPL
jgi:CheY-like chemotaxis protein